MANNDPIMSHTSEVSNLFRAAVLVAFGMARIACCLPPSQDWQSAVEQAARMAPDARIVVLDLKSGGLLAAHRRDEAARTLAAPGSTLKPLVLYALLAEGRWNAAQRVACDRQLTVAGHRLACSHPAAPPFDAREALAWSCNSYFAQVAQTLPPGELGKCCAPPACWISLRSPSQRRRLNSASRALRTRDSGAAGGGGDPGDALRAGRGLSLAGATIE